MVSEIFRNFVASLPVVDLLNTGFGAIALGGKVINNPVWELVAQPNILKMDQTKLKELQVKAIKYSFKYHYDNCKFYRDYCKSNGDVRLEDIHSVDDIFDKIPQIPAEAFKKGGIISIPKNRIKTVVTTSGTTGRPSYLVRDFCSLLQMGAVTVNYLINVGAPLLLKDYFDGSMSKLIKYVFTNWYIAPLVPDPRESSSWFSNGFLSIIPFLKLLGIPHDFLLKGFEFDPKKILDTIKEETKKNKMLVSLGFHYVFNELMKYMDETGETLELDPDGSNMCFIGIAGGWKKLSGDAIDKEAFRKKLADHFGLYEPHICDIYGFGETNLLTFDFCPNRNMHLLPMGIAVTRDPDTLEVQDYGEKGLMSVYDPTMHSFPSFVISDDIVKLTEPFECDGCGAITQTVEYVGRAEKAELRSCGLKTQQILTDESMRELEILRTKALREGIGF